MTTILLIEDDIVAARLVQKVLGKTGYTLHHASTGLDGLAMAHELQPDLVLVDLGLPDLDGKVVALQMSHFLSARSSMIVAFTAENGSKAKRLALAYGCQDYITKPIDTRAFPETIAQLIETVKVKRVHP